MPAAATVVSSTLGFSWPFVWGWGRNLQPMLSETQLMVQVSLGAAWLRTAVCESTEYVMCCGGGGCLRPPVL
jgi:hypothetical protein